MSIIMTGSCILSRPNSLLYTKTKFPTISNSAKPFKQLQNPSSYDNSSRFSPSLSLTTRRRRTRHSSLLTFAVGGVGNSSEDLKIYVGNLTQDTDVEKLKTLFGQVGTVVHAEVIYTWVQYEMFGCVTMSTVEEVEKAMNKFNGYELAGNFLTVSKDDIRKTLPDLPKRPRAFDSAFSVYVTQLPRSIESNEHLEQLFSKHCKVESAELVCDKVTGRSRGFGFVTMSSETDMKNAIAALHGQKGAYTSIGVVELSRTL